MSKRKEKDPDAAWNVETGIHSALTVERLAQWTLAERLYEFHEDGYWTDLGYDSLVEFLAQPELSLSRTEFFALVRLWRTLVVKRGVNPKILQALDPDKVRIVVPSVARSETEVDQALDDATRLGASDLREKYRKGRGKDGKLAAEEEPDRVRCPTCNSYVDADAVGAGTNPPTQKGSHR
jgi:hypothetical protein